MDNRHVFIKAQNHGLLGFSPLAIRTLKHLENAGEAGMEMLRKADKMKEAIADKLTTVTKLDRGLRDHATRMILLRAERNQAIKDASADNLEIGIAMDRYDSQVEIYHIIKKQFEAEQARLASEPVIVGEWSLVPLEDRTDKLKADMENAELLCNQLHDALKQVRVRKSGDVINVRRVYDKRVKALELELQPDAIQARKVQLLKEVEMLQSVVTDLSDRIAGKVQQCLTIARQYNDLMTESLNGSEGAALLTKLMNDEKARKGREAARANKIAQEKARAMQYRSRVVGLAVGGKDITPSKRVDPRGMHQLVTDEKKKVTVKRYGSK